jgi:hypothetical protein
MSSGDRYKVVHMVPKAPLQTLAEYDELVEKGEQAADRQRTADLQRGAHNQ